MIPFWKLQGIGNDFVVVEAPLDPKPEEIQRLCSRPEGIGSDGLLVIDAQADESIDLRMWNPDGSESHMCGNGLRCAALWADLQLGTQPIRTIRLGGENYEVRNRGNEQYQVGMGKPDFDPRAIGLTSDHPWIEEELELGDRTEVATAVSMGNPHLVFFVDSDLEPFLAFGPQLEKHPKFMNRTNVHFARLLDRNKIEMVTWERGAGPTLACGSGACAVAVAAWKRGLSTGQQTLRLPGGTLQIENGPEGVTMTGPAALSFTGTIVYP